MITDAVTAANRQGGFESFLLLLAADGVEPVEASWPNIDASMDHRRCSQVIDPRSRRNEVARFSRAGHIDELISPCHAFAGTENGGRHRSADAWCESVLDRSPYSWRDYAISAVTNRPYSGCNVILLWMAHAAGYRTPRYLTFKQALELGSHVRKGERGTKVYFVKQLQVRDQDGTKRPHRGSSR